MNMMAKDKSLLDLLAEKCMHEFALDWSRLADSPCNKPNFMKPNHLMVYRHEGLSY